MKTSNKVGFIVLLVVAVLMMSQIGRTILHYLVMTYCGLIVLGILISPLLKSKYGGSYSGR